MSHDLFSFVDIVGLSFTEIFNGISTSLGDLLLKMVRLVLSSMWGFWSWVFMIVFDYAWSDIDEKLIWSDLWKKIFF